MKQIYKAEVKCYKHEKFGEVSVRRKDLKKYAGKRVIVKIFLK